MKKFANYLVQTVAYIAEILLGVVLLINPEGFTSWIVVVAGIAMIVVGLWHVLRYFNLEPVLAMREHDLSTGLFLAAAGVICIFWTGWVLKLFSHLTMLYAIALLILGFIKLQSTVDLLRLKRRGWVLSLVNAALTVILSVIILIDPFGAMSALWQLTGVSIIVIALLDIAVMIFSALKPEDRDDGFDHADFDSDD